MISIKIKRAAKGMGFPEISGTTACCDRQFAFTAGVRLGPP